MRFTAALIIGIVAALPASAQTGYNCTVDGWKITGSGGKCIAEMGAQGTALIVASPLSATTHGSIGLSDRSWTVEQGRPVIELVGEGPWARAWQGLASSGTKTYWIPFLAASDADQFPDNFVMRARIGGREVANFFVTGFKTALAEVRKCASETGSY